MTLKFVPPKEDRRFPRYASWAAGQMKTHGGIGFAKNSLNNRMWVSEVDPNKPEVEGYKGAMRPNYRAVTSHSFLLENVDGEYFVLYEIKPGLTKNELPWMKEYFHNGYGWTPVSDYYLNSSYYGPKIESGEYRREFRPTPMTTDEYVSWRIAVELEKRGLS